MAPQETGMPQREAVARVRTLSEMRQAAGAGVYGIADFLQDNGIQVAGRTLERLENNPEKYIHLVYKHPELLKTWYRYYESPEQEETP